MNGSEFWRGLGILVVVGLGGVWPAGAELPSLQDENRWLGYFVGFENRKCSLAISAKKGEIALRPIGRNGKATGRKVFVGFECLILETLPDGTVKALKPIPASLESDQEATHEPKGVTIRGKVKGDAKFELTLNEERGKFTFGGRVVDAGSITHPIRFAIQAKIQNAYPQDKKDPDKQRHKAFEAKTKDDRVQLVLADGNRLRPSTSELIAQEVAGLNGALVTAAQVEFSSWQENRLQLAATGGSTMRMEVSGGNPLWKGFSLIWSTDPKIDSQPKAMLEIEMR